MRRCSRAMPNKIWIQTYFCHLAFLGFVNIYSLRISLSVALVAMVNSTDGTSSANKSTSDECPDVGNIHNKTHKIHSSGEYNWDANLQGIILGSFFYGYIVTQVPGGRLAEKIGGKILYGLGVLVTAILTLATPVVVRTMGVGAFITLRILMGIGEGVTYPAMHCMLGKWCPKQERSRLTTFIYSGGYCGTVVSLAVSGVLCNSNFLGGWPSVFYVTGAVSCLWCVFWLLYTSNSPRDHKYISKAERDYIESGVGQRLDLPVPWKAILSSRPVWGICIAFFCYAWGGYILLTCLPTYMHKILKVDLSSDGFLSSLPTVLSFFVGSFSGILADFVRRRYISTKTTRKLFTSFGMLVSAVIFPFIHFAGCNETIVLVMLVAAGGLSSTILGGFMVNHIDLSCNFSGTLFGITNMFGTAAGMLGPLVVGLFTNHHSTIGQWQLVFYITAGINVIGIIAYVTMAEGEEQDWNRPDYLHQRKQNKNIPNGVTANGTTANGIATNGITANGTTTYGSL
ncbi:hypothetical protein FSP39_020151 [Pinctada imbricata]|uniref:Sialin n=1 Tax=Pinctada imbricata TaxID=66713 RepID=A0AA88XVJ7_PINIB|nr:hypothetical protein FSP39_020151 [Pinctada imbricata]